MASKEERGETISDRVVESIETLDTVYVGLQRRIRTFSPYFVKTVEVILAIALLVFLIRWGYTYYTV